MTKTNPAGKVADSISSSLKRVNEATDKIVERTAELEKKTLDRFHGVNQGLDEWEHGLDALDDWGNQNTNNPPEDTSAGGRD